MGVTFANRQCVDPSALHSFCLDHDLPADLWLGKANQFRVTRGREPGAGSILLLGDDLDTIDLTKSHTLKFVDEGGTVQLRQVTLTQAFAVVPSNAGTVYLCELADRRFHLARIPIDKGYNLRNANGDDYLSASLNSGDPWTWAELIDDIWAELDLGVNAPSLPFTPHGTPENLAFFGGYAWDALNNVLDRLACEIIYDPTADAEGTVYTSSNSPWAIVRIGSADPETSSTLRRLKGDRTWDDYPNEPSRAWKPEKVRVLFRRFPEPTDGSSPFYAVEITPSETTSTGVVAGTVVTLHDDLSALGVTGTPSNSSTLANRAAERASDWERRRRPDRNRIHRIYRDTQPTGVDALTLSNVGAVGFADLGNYSRTEIYTNPNDAGATWRPSPARTIGDAGGTGEGICDRPTAYVGGLLSADGVQAIGGEKQFQRVFVLDDLATGRPGSGFGEPVYVVAENCEDLFKVEDWSSQESPAIPRGAVIIGSGDMVPAPESFGDPGSGEPPSQSDPTNGQPGNSPGGAQLGNMTGLSVNGGVYSHSVNIVGHAFPTNLTPQNAGFASGNAVARFAWGAFNSRYWAKWDYFPLGLGGQGRNTGEDSNYPWLMLQQPSNTVNPEDSTIKTAFTSITGQFNLFARDAPQPTLTTFPAEIDVLNRYRVRNAPGIDFVIREIGSYDLVFRGGLLVGVRENENTFLIDPTGDPTTNAHGTTGGLYNGLQTTNANGRVTVTGSAANAGLQRVVLSLNVYGGWPCAGWNNWQSINDSPQQWPREGYGIRIHWGDSGEDSITQSVRFNYTGLFDVNGLGPYQFKHQYATHGTYTIKVWVKDCLDVWDYITFEVVIPEDDPTTTSTEPPTTTTLEPPACACRITQILGYHQFSNYWASQLAIRCGTSATEFCEDPICDYGQTLPGTTSSGILLRTSMEDEAPGDMVFGETCEPPANRWYCVRLYPETGESGQPQNPYRAAYIVDDDLLDWLTLYGFIRSGPFATEAEAATCADIPDPCDVCRCVPGTGRSSSFRFDLWPDGRFLHLLSDFTCRDTDGEACDGCSDCSHLDAPVLIFTSTGFTNGYAEGGPCDATEMKYYCVYVPEFHESAVCVLAAPWTIAELNWYKANGYPGITIDGPHDTLAECETICTTTLPPPTTTTTLPPTTTPGPTTTTTTLPPVEDGQACNTAYSLQEGIENERSDSLTMFNSLWYEFTPTATGTHTISAFLDSIHATEIDLYATCIASVGGGLIDTAVDGTMSASLTMGVTYYIQVTELDGNSGNLIISIVGP